MKIIVLGAGLVGSPIALDLANEKSFSVTLADRDKKALEKITSTSAITGIEADLSSKKHIKNVVENFDFVISAVPGFMGFSTLQAIIEAGKNVVDIAFFSEDPFALKELADKKGVTAVVDCGVAPGMCHILTAHAASELDKAEEAVIYVGGLPETRTWPYEYKAVFSPIDVIEEYTRTARLVEHGKIVEKPALSELELIDFPGIGTLEAFNSDGLRTLTQTLNIPNMKEKTLRYPGHVERMRMLRETGFFSYDEIDVDGLKIRPIDLTTKLLFPKWKLGENETDITVMQVKVSGEKSGKKTSIVYDLFDKRDHVTGIHSMARTTGYTATVTARMIIEGVLTKPGLHVPEFLGKEKACVDYILNGLKQRGVVYNKRILEK